MDAYYLHIDYTYRMPIAEAEDQQILPKIPITPISYNDAAKLLQSLQGQEAPADWQGTAPGVGTYHVGPMTNKQVSFFTL